MTEMIERVARFMAETYNGGKWETHYTEAQRDVHRGRAKGLLALMREPTYEMVKAGTIGWDDPMDGSPIRPVFDPSEPYRAIINAALNEKSGS